jgi:hypothetical protein
MTQRLLQFARSRHGVAAVVLLVSLVTITCAIRALLDDGSVATTQRITCIDATDGRTFTVRITPGLHFPVRAPSGNDTGFPAEACYWNADGTTRTEPVYVLLNPYRGVDAPTYCHDCGRLVVVQNPQPVPGLSPPPKKSAGAAAR